MKTLQQQLLEKYGTANNGKIDRVSEIDNAQMAEVAPALGLPKVDATSIPLQQGLSNEELANPVVLPDNYNELAQNEANDQGIVAAPAAVKGGVGRAPAASFDGSDTPDQPKKESQIERLERMMAELNGNRTKDLEDAASRQHRGNLMNALASNIGNIVGGAQAMNTKASVTPPKTQGMQLQDLAGIVERKYKPEQEQLMAQYKALKDANQPMTEYQKAMLGMMKSQQDLTARGQEYAMERYYGTDGRLRDKQNWTERQKDEYSDAQSKDLIGFDKTDELLNTIGAKVASGKYDKFLGPYASKYENLKTLNPFSEGMDPEFAAFQSDTTDTLSQYIKSLSGLTVSDKERDALMTSMPKVGDKPKEYMAKLKATQARLREMKKIEMKKLAEYQGKKGATQGGVSLGKTEVSAFPKQVRNAKTGEVATVSNEEELKEAQSEGFN